MARKISAKRIRYGAYQTKKGTRYWIEDTKTETRFKGFTAREFERVSQKLNETKDISRSFGKLYYQTEKGLIEQREKMKESLHTLFDFNYGATPQQLAKFDELLRQFTPEEWSAFVEQNEFFFEELWTNYKGETESGGYIYDSLTDDMELLFEMMEDYIADGYV